MSGGEEPKASRWKVLRSRVVWLLKGCIPLASLALFLLASTRYLSAGAHYLDIPSNFQIHYLVSAIALLMLSALLRYRVGILVNAALIMFQMLALAPYYFGGTPRADSHNLRVGVSNLYGANRHFMQFGEWESTSRPDVLLLQETEEKWPTYLKGIESEYPHREYVNHHVWGFSAAIFSRHPIVAYEIINIPHEEFPVQRAVIEVEGAQVAIYNLHLFPSSPIRVRQNTALRESLLREQLPYIVCGDFNATPWSRGQRQLMDGLPLRNAAFGFGYVPTWPARMMPVLHALEAIALGRPRGTLRFSTAERFAPFMASYLGIPLDHCYVSQEIGVADFQRGHGINSDHLPFTIDLHLPPSVDAP